MMMRQSENGLVDLNEAATKLSVAKRRIYDITNVLEGIGVLEKRGKNCVQYKFTGDPHIATDLQKHSMQERKLELKRLQQQEDVLDRHIEALNASIVSFTGNEKFEDLLYVTHNDIRSIACFSDETLFAVRAPLGSALEVPDPDVGMEQGERRYEIHLSSRGSGPIDVYLIQDIEYPPEDYLSCPNRSTTPFYSDPLDANLIHSDSLHRMDQIHSEPYQFVMSKEEGPSDLFSLGFFNLQENK